MTWWADLYDDLLADQLLEREAGTVEPTLDFLLDRLDLRPGDSVYDQCCGIGSLTIPLAARGLRALGVDQAAGYIERARWDAENAGVTAEFAAANACDFVPPEPVDAVFNWWTSFGYGTDADNQRMLDRAFESLCPGGRFALDTMNLSGVLRGFQRDNVLHRETPRGRVLLLRETTIDLPSGRMLKDWTYFVDGHLETRHRSSVRLYLPDAVAAMLATAGFTDIDLLGDLTGAALTLDSPRLIALARRP
ncbi:class I SAM-dependent methyltransferase [Nocardia sp. NPDC057668]|uniref:class I SAM-dependent methyltransferase n=1 Tax=Nocardia sp. NPDC057668 TaxID=3346202 RepID=UPI00366ECE4B